MSGIEPTVALLAEWRTKYENRRTVPAEMIQALEDIVDAALKTQRVEHMVEVARVQQTAHTFMAALEKRDEELKETRHLSEDHEVKVVIQQRAGGWRLADLEEVAYRLRCGGGTDDTPVKWQEYSISARVVAPNLVSLERPESAPVVPAEHGWSPTILQVNLFRIVCVLTVIGVISIPVLVSLLIP